MKEFLFSIHMHGKARAKDKSELKDIGCKVIFDREAVSIDTMQVEIHSVADIDEQGNVGWHRYATPILTAPN